MTRAVLVHPLDQSVPPTRSPNELAIDELRQKSLCDIQRETAFKWAERALAAKRLRQSSAMQDEYQHEALEHAGLSGSDFVLASIRQLLQSGEADASVIIELQQKSLQDIQRETAFVWAWRAAAAYRLLVDIASEVIVARLRHDAVLYEVEAVEHAVLSGDDGVLRIVRQIILDARAFAEAR